ncbi:MAG TPA: ABC transporter substrate-binding protein [Dehalococcoidia bacterium]|nr:ABC transporter substrate-binding protein [Dehalococcoidia bacterium]
MADLELNLTFAGLDYLDRTRALVDGSVKPEGITLTCSQFSPYELFARVAKSVEFDIAEMSFSTYASLFSQGDSRYIAIPVFLSRHFRHGFIFVHGQSGIEAPIDLVGKRVGVPEYEMTAAVWQRAILLHDYGVRPEQLRWFQGGEFNPGFIERQQLPTPPGVSLDFIPEHQTLHEMVASGDLDALLCPHQPPALLDGSGRVRRLFPNYVDVEQQYYARTGFFPIMHLTVLRRDLYEQHRWIPLSLFRAFVEAQTRGWLRLNELGALAVMLPWLPHELEEVARIMGPNHWPYGFRDNYRILDAMCQYGYEQAVFQRRLHPEELFAPETHSL